MAGAAALSNLGADQLRRLDSAQLNALGGDAIASLSNDQRLREHEALQRNSAERWW